MAASTVAIRFHWADYLVFGLSLLISLLIGVYFAIMARRQKAQTSTDFLLAGRNAQYLEKRFNKTIRIMGSITFVLMLVIPVAMSMLASFLSAIFILGVPAEIMLQGTMFLVAGAGYLLGAVVGAHVYVPVFHKMKLTSVYEYLEKRFNKTIRIMGSITFVLMLILYMSVVMYAPAVAFTAVTGLSLWITIFGIGAICTLYTAMGGMKAVIWTDTFQMVVIVVGLVVLVVKGAMDTGGIVNVWNISKEGGRIDFGNISPDPRERHTWWTQTVGTCFGILSLIAGNQIVIQRYLSVPTARDAQISIYLALAGGVFVLLLCGLLGLVIYAYYECDPLQVKGRRAEEVVPLFMMQVLGHLHGLPGLFTASVFAASLSTVSSAVQALAAVFTEDIIRPLYLHFKLRAMSEKLTARLAKGLALFFGLLTIGLSYIAPYLGPFLVQIAMSILGTAGGPLFGLFTLAIFFPCSNSWGAGIGLVTSIIFTYWISIGAIIIKNRPDPLSSRWDENCSIPTNSATFLANLTTQSMLQDTTTPLGRTLEEPAVYEMYKISYMWYGLISVSITVIVGLIVSAITGFRKNQPPLDANLVFSYEDRCGCCFTACCSDASWLPREINDGEQLPKDPKVLGNEQIVRNGSHPPDSSYNAGMDNNGFISTKI